MKPRKRYNPRKHRAYSNTGIPMHILVKAATSKEPVISDIAYRHNKRIKQDQGK